MNKFELAYKLAKRYNSTRKSNHYHQAIGNVAWEYLSNYHWAKYEDGKMAISIENPITWETTWNDNVQNSVDLFCYFIIAFEMDNDESIKKAMEIRDQRSQIPWNLRISRRRRGLRRFRKVAGRRRPSTSYQIICRGNLVSIIKW